MSHYAGDTATKSGRPVKTAAGRLPVKCLPDFFPRHKFRLVSVRKPPDATNPSKEFTVVLTLPSKNNIEFTGKGRLEKLAKHEAASAALKYFEIFGSDKMIKYTLPSDIERDIQIEGVSDVVGYVVKIFGPSAKFSDPVQVNVNKTPLWKAGLSVQGFTFEQTGPSKKKAKEAAAITCIKTLKNKDVNIVVPTLKCATFEDSLMELMFKSLREYTSIVPKSLLRFRNMVGIYVHDTQKEQVARTGLIAVAAGGDTVGTLSSDGTVVHDCNAEVLAMRAFRLFLYNQITLAACSKEKVAAAASQEGGAASSAGGEVRDLFVDIDKESGLFKLKSHYQVIMIQNHPAAGDALVFSSLPKRANMKHLLNCQQGAPGALQFAVPIMKSGNPRGLRFLSDGHFQANSGCAKPMFVSPSDKLTLRNVVGIQGSLLSQLILPVFITKYVLHKTAAVSQEALKRSFYGRITQHLTDIPPPYNRVTTPNFVTSSTKLPVDKMYGKWAGWADCQAVGSTWELIKLPQGCALSHIPKLSLQGGSESDVDYLQRKLAVAKEIEKSLVPSSLCKMKLFEKFAAVSKCIGKDIPSCYRKNKASACQYQVAKVKVKQAFAAADLGYWPTKPIDANSFELIERT